LKRERSGSGRRGGRRRGRSGRSGGVGGFGSVFFILTVCALELALIHLRSQRRREIRKRRSKLFDERGNRERKREKEGLPRPCQEKREAVIFLLRKTCSQQLRCLIGNKLKKQRVEAGDEAGFQFSDC
jgi:hypothetical protein